MSVAFRRDGDEEHLEPKFDIPIPPGANLVTAGGMAQIAARVEQLEALLPTLVDEVERTKVARDLRYWRVRLATAEPVAVPAGDVVAFGCRVAFRQNGKERCIDIVGHDEADPAQGKLSFLAPLCRAMLGAEAGEYVDFGGKEAALEIITVAPSPAHS